MEKRIVFSYRGLDGQGAEARGTVEALDKEDALRRLRALEAQGLHDILIETAQDNGRAGVNGQSESDTRKCPFCAEEIKVEATKCKHCGEMLNARSEQQDDQGRQVAEQKLEGYLKRGYQIAYKDESRVQLVRRKKFSLFWALIWFVFGLGVGIVPYILYYWLIKKDEVVNLKLK